MNLPENSQTRLFLEKSSLHYPSAFFVAAALKTAGEHSLLSSDCDGFDETELKVNCFHWKLSRVFCF